MRRFYPLHGGASFSEQYFVYDTEKSPAENRIAYAADPSMAEVAGTLVYPVEEDNKPFDNVNLPDNEIRSFRSHSFYWSPDSKAVFFADMQVRLSHVLVWISEHDFNAYSHLISRDELCGLRGGEELPYLELSSAQIIPSPNGIFNLSADFETTASASSMCQVRTLILSSKEFKPVQPQRHSPSRRLPSTRKTIQPK